MGENIGNAGFEVIPGFPGAAAGALTRAERLAVRAALGAGDVETALTGLVAYLSGLAVGEALFRHTHPAELYDAASVRLTGEAEDDSPDHRSFTALFSGREVTRGAVSTGVLHALGKLPLNWATVAGGGMSSLVVVAELKPLRPARFGNAVAGGRRVTEFEAELAARVCTSLPR